MAVSINLQIAALLLILSIYSSKLSLKFGIPTLLIFFGIGMLFGSNGLEEQSPVFVTHSINGLK
ncbi:MAG: hypothetical protein EA359_09995 [Balneolaceae bacterium]|nr:MAG: hypothetical protein EA359_09995 [Balneolaceae bacterium]